TASPAKHCPHSAPTSRSSHKPAGNKKSATDRRGAQPFILLAPSDPRGGRHAHRHWNSPSYRTVAGYRTHRRAGVTFVIGTLCPTDRWRTPQNFGFWRILAA